ncbi:PA14 domain-containing protein [Sulfurospirillum oryzae]|uniref:PA14 domain-containing protein n=1 Tax=Sulfurospirillum oryzae TaxID=2976535 RepID=UPI0021E99240|nr:PA14 domain-containing protein [Sulfurospirillum oryzae]
MKKNSLLILFFLLLISISNLNAANGLTGKYYNNTSYTEPVTLIRTDSIIDFSWGYGSPSGSINNDNFSIIWSGYIIIPEKANYTFYCAHDDFMSVKINGTQYYSNGTWTGGDTSYNNFSINNLNAGTYPIEIRFQEGGGGAYAHFAWQNNKSIPFQIVPSTNLRTYPLITIADANLTEGNTSYSNMNFTVTISEAANASVQYATLDGTATAGSDYNATNGTLFFRSSDANLTKIISVLTKGDTLVENNETFTIILSNEVNATLARATATGTIINDDMGYCGTNALSNGFHVVNPYNDINKSIEIYCYNNRDFIALPNKNSSNNFVFNSNTLGSTNYYNEATTNGVPFQAIEINAYTLDVIVNPSLRSPQTVSTFQTMGSSFSNINLTATPFAIDWGNTTISNCTQAKLRTAYYGQDVKINSLDYDNKAICNIDKMKLKLLDDYRYLVYDGNEVLQKSCKTMAEAVPTTFLASSSIQGHYWISPFSKARSYNATDITSASRPIVTYCWYQTDLNWVWTFSLAMDGKVTNTKSDLVNKSDTCSKFGLFPFVPNNEDTFERVRAFLYNKKSEWVHYTGTIEEKYNVFMNDHYYLASEQSSIIWPYGSFGVYFPYNGNHDSSGASKMWKGNNGTDNHSPGWMSGSPMHNISAIATDYARVSNDGGDANRDYYSWGLNTSELGISSAKAIYSTTDTNSSDGAYPFSATMGAKGWVSILGAADLNKTNEWFISRTGAGVNFDHSTSDYPYYEPNGNYTGGAWLNFLFDSNGRVRHLDDYDARYAYYDYMCMAEDNYDFTTRYGLVLGPFKAIEHSVASGSEATNTAIQTKVVNRPFSLDIAILNDSLTALEANRNVSVGIFMDDTYMVGSTETPRDIHYFGDIKRNGSGSFNALKTTGRFELPASSWPSGNQIWPQAKKRLFVKFKYCSLDTQEWTDCWTKTGNTATCISGKETYCKSVDSDDFAVRPNKFDFVITGATPYKAGKTYTVSFYAKDDADAAALNYTQGAPFEYIETKTGCLTGSYNITGTSVPLIDGFATYDLVYSEIGIINVKMRETSGTEFAYIDRSDTSDSQRYITPFDQNISYTPDHFSLASTFKNYNDGNFTYISNDLNMSSELNVTITAKSFLDTNATNYNSACYAKATDYNISYDALTVSPANSITQIKFLETNTSTSGFSLINAGLNLAGISKNIFGTDTNGTAKLNLKLNFDRNTTKSSNPIKLNLRDLNVTDTDTIKGTTDLNQSSLFYYGRVNSTDYRGQSPIPATIRYEVYCNSNCNKADFNITGSQSPISLNWYQNNLHNDLTNGKVTAFTPRGTTIVNPNASNAIVNGFEANTLSLPIGTLAPYTDRIQMTPSSWLLFNLFNANAATNDFNVEFTRPGNWAGEGKLGQTVDVNTSTRTNRRMEW